MIEQSIEQVAQGGSLSESQMTEIVDLIMKGESSDQDISNLLTALHNKGESVDEVAGAARALRQHMIPFATNRSDVVDTCGTGGGATGTFNISTAAAIVAAGAGAAIAKHGNRKSTSKTGSADVLVELGVNIECPVEVVQDCLDQLGICFCFAPLFHPSVRHVMNVRRQLPHPTIFNLLGPLCNPAGSKYQVLGAGRGHTRTLLAEALARLGTTHSIVVHGRDGLGEISSSQPTDVSQIRGNRVTERQFDAGDFGIQYSSLSELKVANPSESAEMIGGVLSGRKGPPRDVVVINAAAALWVTRKCDDLKSAVLRCCDAIDSGLAAGVLDGLVEITNQ